MTWSTSNPTDTTWSNDDIFTTEWDIYDEEYILTTEDNIGITTEDDTLLGVEFIDETTWANLDPI